MPEEINDTSPRTTAELRVLHKALTSELDLLILRRRELEGQKHRVDRRIKIIQTQLGLPPQSIRGRKHLSRLEGVRALLLQARGPMSLSTISREIEVIEGKALGGKHTWNFLARHPSDFVSVGHGLWDLREKWSESDLATEKKRVDDMKAEESARRAV